MSVQLNFFQKKYEIEEKIAASSNDTYHKVIYYSKFHCELNHNENFWCNGKNYSQIECDYTFDALRKYLPQALASVKSFTILRCYDRGRQKMQLYKEGVAYGSSEWVKKTSHQKINTSGTEC